LVGFSAVGGAIDRNRPRGIRIGAAVNPQRTTSFHPAERFAWST